MDTTLSTIFDPFKNLIISIINMLPALSFSVDFTEFLVWFFSLVDSVAFFIPVYDLLGLFSIYFAVVHFHIIWAIVQRIWDAIPLT